MNLEPWQGAILVLGNSVFVAGAGPCNSKPLGPASRDCAQAHAPGRRRDRADAAITGGRSGNSVGLVSSLYGWSCCAAAAWLPWRRRRPDWCVPADMGRPVCSAAVAFLFLASQSERLLFYVPVIVLTLADTASALVGLRYGKTRYPTPGGEKSIEGSVAFFVVGFVSTYMALALTGAKSAANSLLIAALVGLAGMVLEASAWHGLDNLLIPVGAYLVLATNLDASLGALSCRLGAAALCLAAGLGWSSRKWHWADKGEDLCRVDAS